MKKSAILGIVIGILVLVILGILILSPSNKVNENSDNNLAPEVDYSEEDITIMHKDFRALIDSNWEEVEGNNLGYIFYSYFPPNVNRESENVEFIFVSVGHVGEINYTLDELLTAGIENSKTTMPDFNLTNNIIKSGRFFSGKEIEFTGTSGGVMREFVQFFGLEYGNIYTITYSCPLNNCNYYSVYDLVVNSFQPVEAKK